jgi:H+/Cl- antiporter ClcA/CBS domain-containing protein
MPDHEVASASTTEGLPVAPALGPTLAAAHLPPSTALIDPRVAYISAVALLIGIAAALAAQLLIRLIGLITNLAFYGRLSTDFASPAGNHLGLWVIAIPVVGGLIVGLMARYGSAAIRGHGIPETMEKVLTGQSRIPPRVTLLKPLSAAVSIGTGGPFGAEGPIIATGGALGSLVAQIQSTTPAEGKTLLAAGAAAGMAATFGSPVSAVLLAVELLLFEYRPRSIIPVAFAATSAAAVRMAFTGPHPAFAMPDLAQPSGAALAIYVLIGAAMGLASVLVTRAVYAIEDAFERLPIQWMWWPAIGTAAVGITGYFAPRTLGVGYDLIDDLLSAHLAVGAVAFLCSMKFLSWSISLGSGTSGGTLAPLFIIGGGLGTLLGSAAAHLAPGLGVDPRIAALVGMAAIFAGASRALLAAIVFAFETTLQPLGLLPLLGGCSAAFLISSLLMRNSIMTERIRRRGVMVPAEYASDPLEHLAVADVAARDVITLRAGDLLADVRARIAAGQAGMAHTGFPVVHDSGILMGVVTRRDLLAPDAADGRRIGDLVRRPPVLCYSDSNLRDAVNHMVNHDVGRLPVVVRGQPGHVVGIITRSNILAAYRKRLDESRRAAPHIDLRAHRRA